MEKWFIKKTIRKTNLRAIEIFKQTNKIMQFENFKTKTTMNKEIKLVISKRCILKLVRSHLNVLLRGF